MARYATLSSVKVAISGTLVSLPIQADFGEYISGYVLSEQVGKLFVEECYDLPTFPGKLINEGGEEIQKKWMEEGHWTVASWPEKDGTEAQSLAEFTLVASTALAFNAYAGAPFWRLTFKNGGVETKLVRIFARCFERGRV